MAEANDSKINLEAEVETIVVSTDTTKKFRFDVVIASVMVFAFPIVVYLMVKGM